MKENVFVPKGTIFETGRLRLRELCINDYNALYEVLADSDIMRHYPYTFDEKRVMNWITKNIDRYRDFGFGLWAVELKDSGVMIGDCGITMQSINGVIKPEIGYHINKNFQRQGYTKEAAQKCRDWAFESTPFNCLFSYMKESNIASSATAASIGMKQVDKYIDAESETTVMYAITRDEWSRLNR